jgi:hypothetical protein
MKNEKVSVRNSTKRANKRISQIPKFELSSKPILMQFFAR